jgi:Ribbon-helix-helix protein, copG family.
MDTSDMHHVCQSNIRKEVQVYKAFNDVQVFGGEHTMTLVRVSPEVKEIISKIAERTGKSEGAVVAEAVMAYYHGVQSDKEIKSISQPRPITLRFKARCKQCGKELEAGTRAFYQRITYTDNTSTPIITCVECSIFDDSTLATKYIKRYELERTLRGLKKKADMLANEIIQVENEINKFKQLITLFTNVDQYLRELRNYLSTYNHPREAVNKVDEFRKQLRDFEEQLRSIAEDIGELVIPHLKGKVNARERAKI